RLITMRQTNDLLGIVAIVLRRNDVRIGNEVVDPGCAHRAWIAEPVDLDRRGSMGRDARAVTGGIALEIDEDLDALAVDALRCFVIRKRRDIDEAVASRREPLPHRAAVVGA